MTAPTWMPLVTDLKQALAARDRAGANAAVLKLLDLRAPLGVQWRSICELMRVSGELTLAHRAMDAFVVAAGRTPQALYSKAVLLTQSGRMREAHEFIGKLPPDVPDLAGHAYVLGNTAMTMGRMDEARAHLADAVRHRPGWGPAWLTLATAVNLAQDPLGEQLLADAAAAERQGPGDHARYCYALGKLYVDRRDPDAAFAAYARGARLLRSETPYSRTGNTANAKSAMSGYSDGFIERLNAQKSRDTSRPIFVTGLPRSGTTLVEHIIASHSQVADGAELNLVQHVAVQVGGVSGEALEAYLARGGSPDAMAGLYLHLLEERFGAEGRIVDKTIDVSRCLGLISVALPDAPLIWMRRDPLDSAWSCFPNLLHPWRRVELRPDRHRPSLPARGRAAGVLESTARRPIAGRALPRAGGVAATVDIQGAGALWVGRGVSRAPVAQHRARGHDCQRDAGAPAHQSRRSQCGGTLPGVLAALRRRVFRTGGGSRLRTEVGWPASWGSPHPPCAGLEIHLYQCQLIT